jgi:hypothetical protein
MMKKHFKFLSVLFVLISGSYLPNVNAASSTEMLITIAETSPILLQRLNVIAHDDAELLNQLLTMAHSKSEQLERLLNIAETDVVVFEQLVEIFNAEAAQQKISVMGIIDEDDIIQN